MPSDDQDRDRSRFTPYDQGGYASYRELMEVQRQLSKEMETLRAAVNEMRASTRWVRHLAQVILTVFGTAIGGGILYLLKLPGGGGQ